MTRTSPVMTVAGRQAIYASWLANGEMNTLMMYSAAYRYPAWSRQHDGAFSPTRHGLEDYLNSAAIRQLTTGEAAVPEYVIYGRVRAHARETRVADAATTDRDAALAEGRERSTRPWGAGAVPFYVAVYDCDQAYPVAVFRDGKQLDGAALEFALCTPFAGSVTAEAKGA